MFHFAFPIWIFNPISNSKMFGVCKTEAVTEADADADADADATSVLFFAQGLTVPFVTRNSEERSNGSLSLEVSPILCFGLLLLLQ